MVLRPSVPTTQMRLHWAAGRFLPLNLLTSWERYPLKGSLPSGAPARRVAPRPAVLTLPRRLVPSANSVTTSVVAPAAEPAQISASSEERMTPRLAPAAADGRAS